jgi:hypothetical protein
MFGHDSMPTRVYSYGADIRGENRERAMEVLRTAHNYRNQLVELELKRRNNVEECLARLSPALIDADAAIAGIEAEIDAFLAAAKKIKVIGQTTKLPPDLRCKIKDAKARLKDERAKRKEIRTALFASSEFKAEQQAIEEGHRSAWKQARANCGLHCGTYLVIEQARGGDRSGAPPSFERFDGTGRIAVQIQKGGDFRLATTDSGSKIARYIQADHSDSRWRDARIRVGSDESKNPIWLDFRLSLHRDPPADSAVKWAWLVAKRIGTKIKWQFQLVLARTEWQRKRCGVGTVAVMPGWAAQKDGLRAASWMGTDGGVGHLVIPNEQITRLRKCTELRSIRDRNFEDIKDRMSKMLATGPEWIRERTEHIKQWRAQAKLASVVIAWRYDRWQGDEHAFALAEAWRKQDKHLLEWEAHQRHGVQQWRKNLYRDFSAQMAERYETVVLPKIDWRTFGELPEEEDADGSRKAATAAATEYRKLAAVGHLVDNLKQSLDSHMVDPSGIAALCGNCQDEDCSCGREPDESRCINLLRRSLTDEQMGQFFLQRNTNQAMRMAAGV